MEIEIWHNNMWAIYEDLKAKEMKNDWKKVTRSPSLEKNLNKVSSAELNG